MSGFVLDLQRYEQRTREPWWYDAELETVFASTGPIARAEPISGPLMADAPALLGEVMRLRVETRGEGVIVPREELRQLVQYTMRATEYHQRQVGRLLYSQRKARATAELWAPVLGVAVAAVEP